MSRGAGNKHACRTSNLWRMLYGHAVPRLGPHRSSGVGARPRRVPYRKPKLSSAEAVRIIQAALDGGLSFMDNSWDYHEGESEKRLGKALKAATGREPS